MAADDCDTIIAGHGIAGAVLARTLLERGQRVRVIDAEEAVTSSKIAAGVVTPITGQRLARSWRVDTFRPAAARFFGEAWRRIPHVRLLRNDDERRRWAEKDSDPGFTCFLSSPQPVPLADPAHFHGPLDGFEMQGAWVDVQEWLARSQQSLQQAGAWTAGTIEYAAIHPDQHGVTITAPVRLRARHLVFCEGWRAAANPFFSWLRWKSAKGEILTVRIPDLPESRIINRGLWLLPLGRDRLFRAGSTYEWTDLNTTPTASARADIESRMQALLRLPWQVVDHTAAVRPIINESKALTGLHPVHASLGFFNGLGSKGVLHAPWFAARLASLLIDGTPVEEEVDVRRND